jgi:hypothetical protein
VGDRQAQLALCALLAGIEGIKQTVCLGRIFFHLFACERARVSCILVHERANDFHLGVGRQGELTAQ